MQEYKYSGVFRFGILFSQLGGVFGILFFTTMAVIFIWGAITLETDNPGITILEDPRTTLFCFAFWFFVIGWAVSITIINQLPTLWIIEEGIFISAFLFWRIFIPWSDIVEVRKVKWFRPSYDLVMAKRITVFHRLYG